MTLSAASAFLFFFFPRSHLWFGFCVWFNHYCLSPKLHPSPSPCALFAAEKAFLPIALHRVRAPAIPSLLPLCIPSPSPCSPSFRPLGRCCVSVCECASSFVYTLENFLYQPLWDSPTGPHLQQRSPLTCADVIVPPVPCPAPAAAWHPEYSSQQMPGVPASLPPPGGTRPPGGRQFKRSLVVTKLDLVEWRAFVSVTVRCCGLSLN